MGSSGSIPLVNALTVCNHRFLENRFKGSSQVKLGMRGGVTGGGTAEKDKNVDLVGEKHRCASNALLLAGAK